MERKKHVFSIQMIRDARKAKVASQREHLTWYTKQRRKTNSSGVPEP